MHRKGLMKDGGPQEVEVQYDTKMTASDLEDDYDFEVSDLNCNDSLFLKRPANRNRQSD